jgi:hypothetical protein
MQIHCFFKSTTRKLWGACNMSKIHTHSETMQKVMAATVTMTMTSQKALLLTILGCQNELRNFWAHTHMHEYLGNHIIAKHILTN